MHKALGSIPKTGGKGEERGREGSERERERYKLP
jgi:hypothetical protein